MEEHISDIQFRKLFDGQGFPKGELSAALSHIFRCGSCLDRFVEFYCHPARNAKYDEMFDRLERNLSSGNTQRRYKTTLDM
jgi:hypothetical protein